MTRRIEKKPASGTICSEHFFTLAKTILVLQSAS
jgi:hypothetical protein